MKTGVSECPHAFRNGMYNLTVPEVAVVQSSVTAQKTLRDWDSMTFKFKTRAGLGVDAVFTYITEQRIEHRPSWLLAACATSADRRKRWSFLSCQRNMTEAVLDKLRQSPVVIVYVPRPFKQHRCAAGTPQKQLPCIHALQCILQRLLHLSAT